MKKILFLATALLTLAACKTTQTEESTFSPVRVEGNHFVTEAGDTLIFRGLCLSDLHKMIGDSAYNEKVFTEAAAWGANIVRFPVHPQWINEIGWDSYFEKLDQGIEWAKANNLYVIIDWHSIGNLKDEKFFQPMYNTSKEETFRFWHAVAERYKDEPAVCLYEIFNEPTTTADVDLGACTWTEWKELQEQIIDTIRTYDPKKVCLCAGFNWAYDLTPVANEPIARENIAYVAHPYPMKRTDSPENTWEAQWEQDYGFVADKYPVVCTEMGFCLENEKGAHIPVISTDVYAERITKYFEQKDINFTVWCFDPDWACCLINDWNFTPSTQGTFFKNYLQNKK